MNIIEYKLSGYKKYKLDIFTSGVCKSLAKINVMNDSVIWDSTHSCNIKDYVNSKPNASVTDSFCRCLAFIRKIIEAYLNASDYLIGENDICFDLDYLFIETETGLVKLLPGINNNSLFDSICIAADELRAEGLSDKLKEINSASLMSEKDILKVLSSWELELRQ